MSARWQSSCRRSVRKRSTSVSVSGRTRRTTVRRGPADPPPPPAPNSSAPTARRDGASATRPRGVWARSIISDTPRWPPAGGAEPRGEDAKRISRSSASSEASVSKRPNRLGGRASRRAPPPPRAGARLDRQLRPALRHPAPHAPAAAAPSSGAGRPAGWTPRPALADELAEAPSAPGILPDPAGRGSREGRRPSASGPEEPAAAPRWREHRRVVPAGEALRGERQNSHWRRRSGRRGPPRGARPKAR
jgi:hypothetical protein